MASVTLDGVAKTYTERGGTHIAVHRVDLDINDGELPQITKHCVKDKETRTSATNS